MSDEHGRMNGKVVVLLFCGVLCAVAGVGPIVQGRWIGWVFVALAAACLVQAFRYWRSRGL